MTYGYFQKVHTQWDSNPLQGGGESIFWKKGDRGLNPQQEGGESIFWKKGDGGLNPQQEGRKNFSYFLFP